MEKLRKIFKKCGEIDDIEIMCKKQVLGFVVFKDKDGAAKALELNNTTQKGMQINVEAYISKAKKTDIHKTQKDRQVYVRNIKLGTTSDQVQDHFKDCGDIRKISANENRKYAFIVFNDASSVEKALALHGTELNGSKIGVFHVDNAHEVFIYEKDPTRTIKLINIQKLGKSFLEIF